MNARERLIKYRIDNGILDESTSDLTDEEKTEYLMLRQLYILNTIRYCLLFFVVLAIIGVGAGVVAVLM